MDIFEKIQKKYNFLGDKIFPQKISEQLAIALVLVAGLLMIILTVMYYFQLIQNADTNVIDTAGKNRMLSQKIAYYSELLNRGKIERADELKSFVLLHDKIFYLLKNGGGDEGGEFGNIKKATEEVAPYISDIEDTWIEYKVHIKKITDSALKNEYVDNTESLDFIEKNSKILLEKNQRLVLKYVSIAEKKQSTYSVLLLMLSFFAFFIILLIVGIFSNVVDLIKKLKSGVEIIRDGNLSYRIGSAGKGELAALSRAFDAMAQDMLEAKSNLEEKIQSRTEDLDKKTTDLERQQRAVLNILEDVEEERNNVVKEKDKINVILQSIGDAVLVIDVDYEVFMSNSVVSKISGFSDIEILGKKYTEIFKFVSEKDGSDKKEFIVDAMEKGEIFEIDLYSAFVGKDGVTTPIAATAAPLKEKDGSVIGCVVVFHDVSKEREIDKAKTEFVSLASHQLRTPLSAIRWYSEMMVDTKLDEEQKSYVDEILHGASRMIALVGSLLSVSRLELGTTLIQVEEVSLANVAKDAAKDLVVEAREHKVSVDVKVDGEIDSVFVDKKLTRVVVENLLTNSIKYTKEGGSVTVFVRNIKKDEDFNGRTMKENVVAVSVIDTGVGIPKEQQHKVFEKLFRADNAKNIDTDGTGLGLYLVKLSVERMGGGIWFDSVENEGTTFNIYLPTAKKEIIEEEK